MQQRTSVKLQTRFFVNFKNHHQIFAKPNRTESNYPPETSV